MKTAEGARRGPKPNAGTRTNLLQAGLDVLHAEGYAASSIQLIVEAADVPKGSFYNHFSSKEVFATELIDLYFQRAEQRLDKAFSRHELAPLVRLAAYFDELMAVFRQQQFARGCLLGNLSGEVADHSEIIRLKLQDKLNRWSEVIEDCLKEAQQLNQLDSALPAEALSRFILNAWEGALLRMRVEKDATALQEFRLFVFEHLLAGR
ncbi:hypothetical protein VW41_22535 [Klebsiella michiganensis]|nr:hypothetical protein VW41_22535 [Klebsiella michiganensis]